MSKYTISIKGDWERQGFEVVVNVEDEVVQAIIGDILFTLQEAYGHQTPQPVIVKQEPDQ